MKKPVFYSEVAFFIGIFFLAWGTALTVWADFGISMVVAPAYILHLTVSQYWAWFSFGIAEYVFQAVVLFVMMLLLRRIRLTYFLSFVTAVLYGLLLDAGTAVFNAVLPVPVSEAYRLTAYVIGDLTICAGVALMFKTYLPPEAYEMFVKEIGSRAGIKLHIFKTLYDCFSLVIAVCMSFVLLGELKGIGIGTAVCAVVNGTVIKAFTMLIDRVWIFGDLLPYRRIFEESEKKL